MDFLINLLNKSAVQSPSKLIDYYLAGRPIIDISSDFCEKEDLLQFLGKNYSSQRKKQDVSQFDIRNVGEQFLSLAKNIQ